MIVYKLTCRVNGKAYIGLTTMPFKKRMKGHKCDAKLYKDRAICNAIFKHGWDNFDKDIIYEASSIEELKMVERAMISTHRTMVPFGYNVTSGGDGLRDIKISEKERKRRSDNAKKMHAEGKLTGWPKGQKLTPGHVAKLSAAKQGWKPTDQMREAARLRWTGAGNPLHDPEKRHASNEKRRGKKRTLEQTERIRSAVQKSKNAKLNWNIIREIRLLFKDGLSHPELAAKFGVCRANISMICAGKRWKEDVAHS